VLDARVLSKISRGALACARVTSEAMERQPVPARFANPQDIATSDRGKQTRLFAKILFNR
jgi:hypothetical protein